VSPRLDPVPRCRSHVAVAHRPNALDVGLPSWLLVDDDAVPASSTSGPLSRQGGELGIGMMRVSKSTRTGAEVDERVMEPTLGLRMQRSYGQLTASRQMSVSARGPARGPRSGARALGNGTVAAKGAADGHLAFAHVPPHSPIVVAALGEMTWSDPS